jgi:hypothetical protein
MAVPQSRERTFGRSCTSRGRGVWRLRRWMNSARDWRPCPSANGWGKSPCHPFTLSPPGISSRSQVALGSALSGEVALRAGGVSGACGYPFAPADAPNSSAEPLQQSQSVAVGTGFGTRYRVLIHPDLFRSYRAFRRCENASGARWTDSFCRPTRPRLPDSGHSDRPRAGDRPPFLRSGRERAPVERALAGRHVGRVKAGRNCRKQVSFFCGEAAAYTRGRIRTRVVAASIVTRAPALISSRN